MGTELVLTTSFIPNNGSDIFQLLELTPLLKHSSKQFEAYIKEDLTFNKKRSVC
jgi:hypothetical protein